MSASGALDSLNHKLELAKAGDAAPVSQSEALGELVSLIHTEDTLRDGLPLELIDLASSFHWYRAKARGDGKDDYEFRVCISLMARKVDGAVGIEFDGNYFCYLANEYLAQALGGADDSARQAAIEFASDVCDILYDVHPGLPTLLANIAWTRQSRYKDLGQSPDLDNAIDRARISLELFRDSRPEKAAMRDMLVRLLRVRRDAGGSKNDSEEIARIESNSSTAASNSRSLPSFKYHLKSLSVGPDLLKRMVERALNFALGEELASHLSETKAGDIVVDAALRRLDFESLFRILVENKYGEKLAVLVGDKIGKSIVFLSPLIESQLIELNDKIASSAFGRELWSSLASGEVGRNLSASLLFNDSDWAFRTYANLAAEENAEGAVRALARGEGGRELARLLITEEGGLSFIRAMVNSDRFLALGYYLLDSGSSKELLADLCGSPAMETLVDELLALDDAEELIANMLSSSYFNDLIGPMVDAGRLAVLRGAVADSRRRSDLADRLAMRISGDEEASKSAATLLLSSLLAPVLRMLISSTGVLAAVEVVYIAAVIAATERPLKSRVRESASQSYERPWIPPSTHQRPSQDSEVWIKIIGARLSDGVPAVESSDFEHLERLTSAVYDYMATKDLSNPVSTHQDRILLGLANLWHLAESAEGQQRPAIDFASQDRLASRDDPVDREAVQQAVRSALKATTRERWTRRFEDILINLAATGIAAAIAEAVSRLMHLAPSADAQVYEVDRALAQKMDLWRSAVLEGTDSSVWSSDDELALIFTIHALSVTTISGAYEHRYIERYQAAESELVVPATRLNPEFSLILAQNLGMKVFPT